MLAENVKWAHWAIAYLLTGLPSEHSSFCIPVGFLGISVSSLWLWYLSLLCYLSQGQLAGRTLPGHCDFPFSWHGSTKASPWKHSLPSLDDSIWELLQGYLRSGEAQKQCWAALAKVSMRDWACSSSGGQKGQVLVTALLGAAPASMAERGAGGCSGLWHTYSLNLFTHSYTLGFSSQHCFFLAYSALLFFLVFSYPISYICRAQ